MFVGQPVIHACITHGETSEADIRAVVAVSDQSRLGALAGLGKSGRCLKPRQRTVVLWTPVDYV